MNSALVAAMVYNVNRGKGKRAIRPQDLIGEKKEKKQMTADEMKSIAVAITNRRRNGRNR